MKAHSFSNTAEAYDATQCDPLVQIGDMLIIKSEKVIAVAYTWPIAATEEHGQLHTIQESTDIHAVANSRSDDLSINDQAALIHGYHAAMMTAISEGYPVNEEQARNRIDSLNESIQHNINIIDSERDQQAEDERLELRHAVEVAILTRSTIEAALYRQSR